MTPTFLLVTMPSIHTNWWCLDPEKETLNDYQQGQLPNVTSIIRG
jgi:hypothetical protein